jgi:spore coat polysaccharide biosynthesis protein SpsF (cytidylyltransferase family)
MRVGAIVHARMGSTRLPGKVLGDLAGRPALAWLLERLERATELDLIVVATSTDPADDVLAAWCDEQAVAVHRGPLEDLATRVLQAAEARELDALARVNGDSPVLDQRLVDHGVDLLRTSGADLVSNVRPRSYPPGQSVEVLRTATLRLAVQRMRDDDDREHVTPWLYRHPDEVRALRFANDPPVTVPRLTLDDLEDHRRLEGVLRRMERPHWDYRWDEVVALAC